MVLHLLSTIHNNSLGTAQHPISKHQLSLSPPSQSQCNVDFYLFNCSRFLSCVVEMDKSKLKGHCHAIWQLYKKPEGVFASMEFQN